jgi:MoxR-like ATPase
MSELEEQHWSADNKNAEIDRLRESMERVKDEIQKVVIGQDETIDLLLVAVLAGGHVLLEGVPGIAKTLSAKLLARTFQTDFSRIQFTPDLMPADVTGTTVYNVKTGDFTFSKGPIFSNIVLIDEINRAPAKTQSSLFEVMEEQQVSVDGTSYPMSYPFMVLATQNPIEQEGTYKLPEAQLDRFLFKINLEYPSLEEEKGILQRFRNDFAQHQIGDVDAIISPNDLRTAQKTVQNIFIKDELLAYIATIVHDTRNHPDLYLGASPRASLAILRTSKAAAAMKGREFVTPEDIQYVAYAVLNHRIMLTPEREMEGIRTRDVIKEILGRIEVPR